MDVVMGRFFEEKEIERTFLLSEYGKQKLLAYADSFKEIAGTLDGDFCWGGSGESRQSRLCNRKLWENRCMLADNLNEMAEVMAQIAGEVFSYRSFPDREYKRISRLMKSENIFITDMFYIENEVDRTKLNVTMHTERPEGFSAEEVADMLSVCLDVRLSPAVNCPYFVDKDTRSYTFVEEAKYVLLTGSARAVKETEPKSGDNYTIIESEKGKLTLLLSDGMGSGEKACQDSEMVLDLMEKLMETGYRPKAAANLVNSALIAKGEEQNMSTLDICEVDLYNGICEFTKIGAAASFIKRGHMVEQIVTDSLPLGIFKGIESDSIKRRLMDGDYVFLFSDGIIDAMESDYKEDMGVLLSNLEQQNPKELAESILQQVLKKTGGRIRDDMTILVFGIWENA